MPSNKNLSELTAAILAFLVLVLFCAVIKYICP